MTLDEAKASAKDGILQTMNEYIAASVPPSTLMHAVVWRLNAVIDGATPTTPTEQLLQSIFNFVVLLQQTAQPFFPRIDAAATVDEVWGIQSEFNPTVVPPPSASGTRFYATRLERTLGDPT